MGKRSNTTVSNLASKSVITVRAGSKIGIADAKMKLGDVRHLPVLDPAGKVVGMLSNRDLISALSEANGRHVAIDNVMTEDVITVRPETRAYEAAALMLDRKVGSLPIVDHNGHLTGIVTETDFLWVAYELLGGEKLSVED